MSVTLPLSEKTESGAVKRRSHMGLGGKNFEIGRMKSFSDRTEKMRSPIAMVKKGREHQGILKRTGKNKRVG